MATEIRKSDSNGHAGPMQGPIAPYLLQHPVSAQAAEQPGIQLSSIWHAFRRSWALGIVLGVPMIALGLIPWFLLSPKQTAMARLDVGSFNPRIIFETAEDELGSDMISYMRFQQTIGQELQNDALITNALQEDFVEAARGYENNASVSSIYSGTIDHHPEILANLKPDAVGWVKKYLEISADGKQELLPIVFEHKDGELARAIVNSLAHVYVETKGSADSTKDVNRRELLEQMIKTKKKELQDRRQDFYDRARELGTTSGEVFTLDQESKLNQRTAIGTQMLSLKFERMALEMRIDELKAFHQQSSPESGNESQPVVTQNPVRPPLPPLPVGDFSSQFSFNEETLEEEYRFDLTLRQLQREYDDLQDKVTEMKNRATSPRGIEESERNLARIKDDLELRKAEIKRKLEQHNASLAKDYARQQEIYEMQWREVERDRIAAMNGQSSPSPLPFAGRNEDRPESLEELEFRKNKLEFQEQELQADIDKLIKEIKAIGGDHAELETMKSDIALLEEIVQQIEDEMEKTNFESAAGKRISVAGYAFRTDEDDPRKRIVATIGAGIGGFFLPLLLLMWYDVSQKHVDDVHAVHIATGLTHMGAIPRLPVRNLKQGDVHMDDRVQRALTESVRGIVSQLIRRKGSEGQNCIMVSSARAGEGKTTASIEIAKMLARSGQKTILIDFDLRRPRLHQEFGIDRGPGVYDILTGRNHIDETVVSIDDAKLSVLPAGEPDETVIVESFSGVLTEFFEVLRMQYDFVIVDCCPVLPVVDARIVAQYVDGIILAMTRDVSVVPDAIESRDLLHSHGASVIGTIVSGQPVSAARYNPYV